VRPEGFCQRKIPMTPSGIEPATFWFVAQCLIQLRHRLPLSLVMKTAKYFIRNKELVNYISKSGM
jgi:hypothetical protein